VARYAYPSLDNLPEHLKKEIAARVKPDRGNVWRMLMWAPTAAGPFVDFSEAVRHQSSLNPIQRELIILRVGQLSDAPYEVHHHKRIAREVGMSEEKIAATAIGSAAPGLDDKERLLLDLAEDMVKNKTLSDANFKRVINTFGVTTLCEILLLVGFYNMACLFLRTFQIDIEQPAKG
jgi:4-carboxymuconolactone decarboxylase